MKIKYESREKDVKITITLEDRIVATSIPILVEVYMDCIEEGNCATIDEYFDCMKKKFKERDTYLSPKVINDVDPLELI